MRLRRNIKFDLVIYSCLFGASTLLILGAKSYCASLDEYHGLTSEIKSAFGEIKGKNNTTDNSENEKPDFLKDLNEKEIINNYLYSILDGINTDQKLTAEMIKSWNNFEIINTSYIKEITTTYFSYGFTLKISNKDAQLPTKPNKELSTDDYIVINLIANITTKNNDNKVKSIDIPS